MAKIVSRGDPIEPVYLNNLRVAAHGWGVVSGLAVSQKGAGANMSVDVAAGEAWINGTKVTKGSTTNVAITAAHASYDRYDLAVINSSGTISVINGTAAATSYANDYDLETNNAILLAEVYVPATDTTIEDAQITDKRVLIDPIIAFVGLEEYSNHLGATDNFTETLTNGNGVATADTTNHEMDLSSGANVTGHGIFETKDSITPSLKPLIVNFLIQNIVNGVGTSRYTHIGMRDNFIVVGIIEGAYFRQENDNTWSVVTVSGSSVDATSISALANGDLCTIVLTTSKAIFLVNGIVVATRTTYVPTGAMHVGSVVYASGAGVTTARSISIDYMSMKYYA